MYGCLPGVTIGFDPVTYSVEEGLAVEVCAHIISGTLEIDAIVTLSSSDGEAEGRIRLHALQYIHLKFLTSRCYFVSSPSRFS